MKKLKMIGVVALIVSVGGVFSGCGIIKAIGKSALTKDNLEEMWNYAKPKVVEVATEQAEAAVEKKENQEKDRLDKTLEGVFVKLSSEHKDSVDLNKDGKWTWADFDTNEDGKIGPLESGFASMGVRAELKELEKTGEITKEEARETNKTVGLIFVTLLGLSVAGMGIAKIKGNKNKKSKLLVESKGKKKSV